MSLSGCEVLLASPRPSMYDSLTGILDRCECRVYRSATCEMAVAFLRLHPMGVVVCETELPDGTWRDVLSRVLDLDSPPNLIVAARLADERLWAEVLNLGGYDLLPAPFETEETIRVMAQALWDWNARRSGLSRKAPRVADHYRSSRSEVPPGQDSLLTSGAAD